MPRRARREVRSSEPSEPASDEAGASSQPDVSSSQANPNTDLPTPSSRPDADDIPPEEVSDEEDLMEDGVIQRDYQRIDELDTYDVDELDEQEQEALTLEQRRQAERELERRDRMREALSGRARQPRMLGDDALHPDDLRNIMRRMDTAGDLETEAAPIDIENIPDGVSTKEYIAMEAVQAEVKRRFATFLRSFKEAQTSEAKYAQVIQTMCNSNGQSLEVSYTDLSSEQPTIAMWLADQPSAMLALLHVAAFDVVLGMYENYNLIHDQIFVRVSELPITDNLRDMRQAHLNMLVRVSGVVTRRSNVFPQLKMVYFDCTACGALNGPFVQNTESEAKPNACVECQKRGPFIINQELTVYRNYQKITLQESPGSVPPGRLPRSKEVVMVADLIDSVRPGEEVEITGVYTNNFDASLNTKNGFPVFATVIEANHVARLTDKSAAESLTQEDIDAINAIAKRPDAFEVLRDSIAPSIHGHADIKTGLLLSMLSGVPKDVKGKHRIRGDINVLLLGDPGVAKSQFLKYVEKTAGRAVFTTGKGASAVGLTASVHKDPVTREWTLEGGALVLADTGVCLIDEFDKMNDQDRTSIHEAMEQQSISVSKAGIVTTLQARCAVIAAANPKNGKYNAALQFHENVDLSDPILSRFDVLSVVRDTVDPIQDEELARFVVSSHRHNHPLNENKDENSKLEGPISQDLLRKFLRYAKVHCQPTLANLNQDKMAEAYASMRRASEASGGIPIAVRHIESMVRCAEAKAKCRLRNIVDDSDIDFGISVVLESFVQSQKYAAQKALRKEFSKYLVAAGEEELLLFTLRQLFAEEVQVHARAALSNDPRMRRQDGPVAVDIDSFAARARDFQVMNVDKFLKSSLFSRQFAYDSRDHSITRRDV